LIPITTISVQTALAPTITFWLFPQNSMADFSCRNFPCA
jgi:hypothetical protein